MNRFNLVVALCTSVDTFTRNVATVRGIRPLRFLFLGQKDKVMRDSLLVGKFGLNGALLASLVFAGSASASTISFLGEIHTGNNDFSIYNNSDSGIFIQDVTVTLNGGAVFSTLPAAPFLDSGISVTHFSTDGDLTDDFNVSGVEGDAATEVYDTSVLNNEGYTGSLLADIADGGTTATFNFNDFAAGEAFGFFVDYDLTVADGFAPGNTSDNTPGGSQLNGTTIDVTFVGAGGETDTLSMIYNVTGGAGKKSFPTDPVPFNATSTLQPVPIPPAVWLFGSGLLGMVGIARRKAA